jgi:hypothetical protein
VHASPDSFTYLGAADSLAHGRGWTYPFGNAGAPVTLFPPLYPLLLVVPELLGVSVFHWVTWQNAILLVAFSFLVGVTVLQATRSFAPAAFAALFVGIGTPTITVYAHLWSEPLFFPLVVVILAALARFLATGRTRWLVIAAAASSIAMLTRYAGLSVFAASCLLLLGWPGRRPLERLGRTALFTAIALPLSVLWSLRNFAASGTLTGNNNLVHGLTAADVVGGIGTVGSWFVPEQLEGNTRVLLVAVVASVLLLVGLVVWVTARRRAERVGGWTLVVVCVTYAVVHFVFIAVANAFSTRSPPFNDRILGPAFAPLVIAAAVAGHATWRAFARERTVRPMIAVVGISVLVVSAIAAIETTRILDLPVRGTSVGYERIARSIGPEISADAVLLSNRANIAWFLTSRQVTSLPRSCRGGQVLPNPTYDQELRDLSRRLGDDRRQVILFRRSPKCAPYSLEGLKAALRVETLGPIAPVFVLGGPAPRR